GVARSIRSSRLTILVEIVLPSAMPLAGVRLAAGRVLNGAVIAKFFISVGGLVYYNLYKSRFFHPYKVRRRAVARRLGVGFEFLVNWATRRFMPWYGWDKKRVSSPSPQGNPHVIRPFA